ncbi:MAG: adenylate/guanylate cyclase domain-containing protein [Acidimicrobiales bacterium]
MLCSSCGVENATGAKFCSECGSPLARACPNCGSAVQPTAKFCSECGTTLAAVGQPVASAARTNAISPATGGTSELRHVSVLFCDLVGFTPLSESKDPEDVRELLSGYFDLARSIVGRYGGTVEKFIGDAVMAVWGAPAAKEDDAERAVRAGLELVSAVADYGSERSTDLQARVGIVTGGVATTETKEEGMVIGDRVNMAARIQSVAPPGCCYVDEATRAATAVAISYVDVGLHELKGKSEPVHLHQATRIAAALAGSQRSSGLEAPFVGRDHELRLVKELFRAAADRHSARLALVSGVAGVGKSRLAWEFFKYLDGLVEDTLWHAGRCLSYGEGVSYWALSEMVRSRLQIGEEDPLDVAAERLRVGLERWILDPADREFIAPRLGQLLGLPAPQLLAKEDLFAGWRLFFERLSEHSTVAMLVEDLQWADAGLVDFLDHLLEWSADHAIFLLVLTRPEGTEKRGLGLSRRNVTTVSLDPLADELIGELLDGLVSELPAPARASIVERAEGIPLYAVETVRSLLDKGILTKGTDGGLHLVGELGTLEIPPGLTALIASRLDSLSPDERRLVKECSVLGGSFPRQAIEAVTDTDPGELDALLTSLVRKEVLTVRADKLSPERGQYAFTQSLIRSVAYDMLTKAERKARHIRTAEHLRNAFPDQGAEVAEVIAAHLNDAYKAAGDDPIADDLRDQAKRAYAIAAERAESVGAPESAEAAYVTAAELSSDGFEQANLMESAGRMASLAGFDDRASAHFEAAIRAHQSAGRAVEAARAIGGLSRAVQGLGHTEQAIVLIREALASLDPVSTPPDVIADLNEKLGSSLVFAGHLQDASESIEQALTIAQHYELTQTFARALVRKAVALTQLGRVEEARINYEAVIDIARRHGLTDAETLAEANLGDLCMKYDLAGAEEHCEAALALARRSGARYRESIAAGNLIQVLTMAGRFEEAYQRGIETLTSSGNIAGSSWVRLCLAEVDARLGRVENATEHFASAEDVGMGDDVQDRAGYLAYQSSVALAEGDFQRALEGALRAIAESFSGDLGVAYEAIRIALPNAIDAAIAVKDLEGTERIVELLSGRPPGEVPPFVKLQIARARALLCDAKAEYDTVEDDLVAAEQGLLDLGYPYWTARCQLDLAEWFGRQGRAAEAAARAGEAASTFEMLGAKPMLTRARALLETDESTSFHAANSQTAE